MSKLTNKWSSYLRRLRQQIRSMLRQQIRSMLGKELKQPKAWRQDLWHLHLLTWDQFRCRCSPESSGTLKVKPAPSRPPPQASSSTPPQISHSLRNKVPIHGHKVGMRCASEWHNRTTLCTTAGPSQAKSESHAGIGHLVQRYIAGHMEQSFEIFSFCT